MISARGDSLKDLGKVEGLIFLEHAFRIDVSIESDDEHVHIPNLQAQFGESELQGRFSYEFGDIPNIEIALDSPLLDLAPMIEEREKQSEQAESDAEAEPAPAVSSGLVIPDLPVPVELLNQMNLVAEIDVIELRTPRRVLKNIEIDASLRDGDLRVTQFHAQGEEGDLSARFRTFVEGNGISVATMQGAVESAAITQIPDTVPPNPSTRPSRSAACGWPRTRYR